MAAKSIKEEVVGDPPLCHSVELLLRADGQYEVVARLMPDRGPQEASATYFPPMLSIEAFTNKAEAEFRFSMISGLMRRAGIPR